jgi:hypothetical protein
MRTIHIYLGFEPIAYLSWSSPRCSCCWSCCHPCRPRPISRLGILDDTCCLLVRAACSALLLPMSFVVIFGYGADNHHRPTIPDDDGLLLVPVSTWPAWSRRPSLSCSVPGAAAPCCLLPLLHPCRQHARRVIIKRPAVRASLERQLSLFSIYIYIYIYLYIYISLFFIYVYLTFSLRSLKIPRHKLKCRPGIIRCPYCN